MRIFGALLRIFGGFWRKHRFLYRVRAHTHAHAHTRTHTYTQMSVVILHTCIYLRVFGTLLRIFELFCRYLGLFCGNVEFPSVCAHTHTQVHTHTHVHTRTHAYTHMFVVYVHVTLYTYVYLQIFGALSRIFGLFCGNVRFTTGSLASGSRRLWGGYS